MDFKKGGGYQWCQGERGEQCPLLPAAPSDGCGRKSCLYHRMKAIREKPGFNVPEEDAFKSEIEDLNI